MVGGCGHPSPGIVTGSRNTRAVWVWGDVFNGTVRHRFPNGFREFRINPICLWTYVKMLALTHTRLIAPRLFGLQGHHRRVGDICSLSSHLIMLLKNMLYFFWAKSIQSACLRTREHIYSCFHIRTCGIGPKTPGVYNEACWWLRDAEAFPSEPAALITCVLVGLCEYRKCSAVRVY